MYLRAAIQPGCGSKKKLTRVCCSTGTQAIGAASSSAGPRHASGSLPMIRSIIGDPPSYAAFTRANSKVFPRKARLERPDRSGDPPVLG